MSNFVNLHEESIYLQGARDLLLRLQDDFDMYVVPLEKLYSKKEPEKYEFFPIGNTAKYNDIEFDYGKFYEWCLKQREPLYISEYDMPKSDFICIAAKEKTCSLSATYNSLQSVEKLFIPKTQVNNKPLTLF